MSRGVRHKRCPWCTQFTWRGLRACSQCGLTVCRRCRLWSRLFNQHYCLRPDCWKAYLDQKNVLDAMARLGEES